MNKPKSLKLGPWYKGVRYDAPPEELDEHELSGGENFSIGERGQLTKRAGYCPVRYRTNYGLLDADTLWVTQRTGKGPINLLTSWTLSNGSQMILVGYKDGFYTGIYGFQNQVGVALSTQDEGAYFSSCETNSYVLLCNGGELLHVPLKCLKSTGALTACDVDSRFASAYFVEWWDNRAWWAKIYPTDFNRVWYSDPLDVETYGATSYMNVGGDILGVAAMREQLVIHTEKSIWTIKKTGNDTIPYELTEFKINGGIAPRAQKVLPDGSLFYVRPDGCYVWDGSSEGGVKKVSQALDYGYWPGVTQNMLQDAHSVYVPNKRQIWLWLPHGLTSILGTLNPCNHVMVYEPYDNDGSEEWRWVGPHTGASGSYAFFRGCSCLYMGTPIASSLRQYSDAGATDQTHSWVYEHGVGTGDTYQYADGVSKPGDSVVVKMWAITATASPEGEDGGGTYRWLFARHAFDTDLEYTFGVEQTGEAVRFISMWKLETFTPDGGFVLDDEELDVGDLGDVGPFYVESPLTGYASNAGIKYSEDSYYGGVTFWSVRLYYHDLSTSRRYRGAS